MAGYAKGLAKRDNAYWRGSGEIGPKTDPGKLGADQLRSDLATHLRRAGSGDRVIVTVDGRPTAQLAPIEPPSQPQLDDLAAAGLVRQPNRPDHPSAPDDLPLLPVDLSIDQVLAELRGDPPRRR